MNKELRKRLSEAQEMLEKAYVLVSDAQGIIEEVKDEEQEKFDNATEGQQAMEKFQAMEENASILEELYDTLDSIMGEIEDAKCDESFDL